MPERFRTSGVGAVNLGDVVGTSPITDSLGLDSGRPIDHYYIDKFLVWHSSEIRGRVLEFGGNNYTVRFGGVHVGSSEVLHVDASNSGVTIVGDLSASNVPPTDAFDCIIFTQTQHLIYGMRKALANLARSLKQDGVLLVTVPEITPIHRGEWGFGCPTELAPAQLPVEYFDPKDIFTENFGNVLAVCFPQGLAVAEVPAAKLDSAFPVVVAARVIKRKHQ